MNLKKLIYENLSDKALMTKGAAISEKFKNTAKNVGSGLINTADSFFDALSRGIVKYASKNKSKNKNTVRPASKNTNYNNYNNLKPQKDITKAFYTKISEGQQQILKKGDSIADILAKMFNFMKKVHEEEIKEMELTRNFNKNKSVVIKKEKEKGVLAKLSEEDEDIPWWQKILASLFSGLAGILGFLKKLAGVIESLLAPFLNFFKNLAFRSLNEFKSILEKLKEELKGKDGRDGRDGKDGKNGKDGKDVKPTEEKPIKPIDVAAAGEAAASSANRTNVQQQSGKSNVIELRPTPPKEEKGPVTVEEKLNAEIQKNPDAVERLKNGNIRYDSKTKSFSRLLPGKPGSRVSVPIQPEAVANIAKVNVPKITTATAEIIPFPQKESPEGVKGKTTVTDRIKEIYEKSKSIGGDLAKKMENLSKASGLSKLAKSTGEALAGATALGTLIVGAEVVFVGAIIYSIWEAAVKINDIWKTTADSDYNAEKRREKIKATTKVLLELVLEIPITIVELTILKAFKVTTVNEFLAVLGIGFVLDIAIRKETAEYTDKRIEELAERIAQFFDSEINRTGIPTILSEEEFAKSLADLQKAGIDTSKLSPEAISRLEGSLLLQKALEEKNSRLKNITKKGEIADKINENAQQNAVTKGMPNTTVINQPTVTNTIGSSQGSSGVSIASSATIRNQERTLNNALENSIRPV
jgi:hypothetical protein